MKGKPQEPVKIVLQDIQTKPLSNGYNAIIKGTGDMTKGKEYFSKWYQSEFEADKALEALAGKNGCVVSIDKWHTKDTYQNWESYTLHEDEEAPTASHEERVDINATQDERAATVTQYRECGEDAIAAFRSFTGMEDRPWDELSEAEKAGILAWATSIRISRS